MASETTIRGENVTKTQFFDVSPLNGVIKVSLAEFKSLGIKKIVTRFQPILDEFYAFTEFKRDRKPNYNSIFNRFIKFICKEYDLKINPTYVRLNAYDQIAWGQLYWSFVHLSSILLTHAFVNKKTTDLLDFPSLIYNIDSILPCSLCEAHYLAIKDNVELRECVKNMSFGFIMSGLQTFHNIVNRNLDLNTQEFSNRPTRPIFTIVDFAQTYNCIEISDVSLKKSNDYVLNVLDWQSDTHSILTTLLAVSSRQTYVRASCLIKRVLYSRGNTKSQTIHTEEDLKFEKMGKEEVLEKIAQSALLLNLNGGEGSTEDTTALLNAVIFKFYSRFPEVVASLLDNANKVEYAENQEKPNAPKILSLLDEICKKNIDTRSS